MTAVKCLGQETPTDKAVLKLRGQLLIMSAIGATLVPVSCF